MRLRSIGAVALFVGLGACSSDHSAPTTTGTAGAGGSGVAGSSGTGGAGGAASGGIGGTAGDGATGTGGSGGAVAKCDSATGGGGAGGIAAGCDVAAAGQALATLGIGTTGAPTTFTMALPATLTDAQWSVKSEACRQGGYDLSPVAGMTVCLLSQEVTGTCQDNPAKVYVVMSNGAVVCIYRALCPGSRIAPGVYSAVDPLCVP